MLGLNLSNSMVCLRYFVVMRFGEYFGLCFLERPRGFAFGD